MKAIMSYQPKKVTDTLGTLPFPNETPKGGFRGANELEASSIYADDTEKLPNSSPLQYILSGPSSLCGGLTAALFKAEPWLRNGLKELHNQ